MTNLASKNENQNKQKIASLGRPAPSPSIGHLARQKRAQVQSLAKIA
jgi:hypothetical protein